MSATTTPSTQARTHVPEVAKLIEHIRSPHADVSTQRRQLDLLQELNAAHQQQPREDGQQLSARERDDLG